ncbi:MAG: hypothetical protein J5859_05940 [Clostridia bacterium]|nr:hypothetical protein [Clostridia bacterium]
MEHNERQGTLINISRKAFIEVVVLLAVLLCVSVALTYILPKTQFGVLPDGEVNYLECVRREDQSGIALWEGLLAPVLVFASGDGLSLIMLSLFLIVVSAVFQVMSDIGGIRAMVSRVSRRFDGRGKLLLVMISFLFYCFGSFLGLFEEMLTMLPIVAALCVTMGFDSFTGFICSILSCGFGFAGAITNPFTVLLACEIIGANPMEHIWFRFLIFLVMFGLLMAFLFAYLKRLQADPSASLTLEHDRSLRLPGTAGAGKEVHGAEGERGLSRSLALFLAGALGLIIVSSLLPALRSYTVVILIAYFLFAGLPACMAASGSFRIVLRSFVRGVGGALPTVVFIALAASIKYVFDRGAILPTIVGQINNLIAGNSPVTVALFIYLIVLLLEFFISSSTAKAILVMGLLAMVNTGLSRQMLVLLYTFGDGYTNVCFPTSPVLLISLSMIGVKYFTWLQKSRLLFAANFLLVIAFIILGVFIGY